MSEVKVRHLRYLEVGDSYLAGPFTYQDVVRFRNELTEIVGDEIPVSIFPRGGRTIAEVVEGDEVVAVGEATCSLEDNYSRKIGRSIAVGRALKTAKVAT